MNGNIYKEARVNLNAIKNIAKGVGKYADKIIQSAPPTPGVSRSVKEFEKNLKNSNLKIKPVNGKNGVKAAVDDLTKSDFGLAGMVGGGVAKGGKVVYKKLPKSIRNKTDEPLKRVVTQVKDVRSKADRAVMNADIKAGAIAHKYAPGKSKNLFVQKRKVELNSDTPGVKQKAEFGVTKMTEPLNKAKKVVLLIVGANTVANSMEKLKYKPEEEKTAIDRDELIDKIANVLENKVEDGVNTDYNSIDKKQLADCFGRMSKIASEASSKLMLASYTNEVLFNRNSALEKENRELKLAFEENKKQLEVEKLASDMITRGMLTKYDYDSKVNELKQLDSLSFNLFKEAIYKMPVASTNGIDKLSYVLDSNNESSSDKKKELYETFDD